MNTRLTILTGTTRGLGAAMAAQLASQGGHLVTVARSASAPLAQLAQDAAFAAAGVKHIFTIQIPDELQKSRVIEVFTEGVPAFTDMLCPHIGVIVPMPGDFSLSECFLIAFWLAFIHDLLR